MLKLGYSEGQWVEVRQGLKEGDPVVIAGKSALRDGTAVKVLEASAPAVKATTPAEQAAQ